MTAEPQRPSPGLVSRYGPLALIVAMLAGTMVLLVATDPIRSTAGPSTTVVAGLGAASLADIEAYPPGVMPLAKAIADGTQDRYTWGKRCDMRTKTLAIPMSPPPDCFAEFTGDNGGATSVGVTRDTIKVVVYLNKSDDALLRFIYGQIGLTSKPGDDAKTYEMLNEVYGQYFETYGRKVEIVPYRATGGITDAVAAAADAETIARDLKPFAVLGGPQLTNAFGDALAANKVLCVGCAQTQMNQWLVDRSPYVWDIQKTLDQNFLMVGEYIVKRLSGRPAAFAGDPALRKKKRVFGFIHATTAEGTNSSSEQFTSRLADQGVDIVAEEVYLNPLTLNVDGRDMITRLKEKGVTSVLLATDPVAPQGLTRVATDQNYFPEWIMTGQTLVESTVFSRSYDQRQWAHAFGPTNRFPYVEGGIGSPLYLFKWYFGVEAPAQAATLLMAPNLQVLYSALQGMGPNVSPAAFKEVLFRAPVIPGSSIAPQISFGSRGFFPDPDYTVIDDQAEMWWDPDTTGPNEGGLVGKGVWMYANNAKRYTLGKWPKGQPTLDPATSIYAPKRIPPDAVKPGKWAPIAGPRRGRTLSEDGTIDG